MDGNVEIMTKWAEMVIRIWEERMLRLRIVGSSPPQLLNSFFHTVQTQANGDVGLIVFTFNWYGRMVDMGVGRGVPLSLAGSASTKRQKAPWYSQTFVVEVRKLTEFLAKQYGIKAAILISDEIGRDITG